MGLSPHVEYYLAQTGAGYTPYTGPNFQRGHGFISGLFRSIVPLLKRGARFVGKQMVHSGADFLNDVVQKRPVKEAFQSRLKEAGDAISAGVKRKVSDMTGSGILSAKRRKVAHSRRVTPSVNTSASALRTVKKKTARKARARKASPDIFT